MASSSAQGSTVHAQGVLTIENFVPYGHIHMSLWSKLMESDLPTWAKAAR